ncbi:MAG: AAA family ATPase [PVC group bacterium]|nr:AAA family ATPase [PVC group bacterium]
MQLKQIYIKDQYKNLKDFKLNFDGQSFIDVFVGKNGTGKSNLFEALLEIFRHLYESNKKEKYDIHFNYFVSYEIDEKIIEVEWDGTNFTINGEKNRVALGVTPMPDNVLIYYSGHNSKVTELVQDYETNFKKSIKTAEITDTSKFVGIDKEYKQILLAVLLIQKSSNKLKKHIQHKLGVKNVCGDLKLVCKRPYYALSNNKYDIVFNDETDRFWKPEGIVKEFLDRLEKCASVSTGRIRTEGYFDKDHSSYPDQYIRYFDIQMIQKEFEDVSAQIFFRNMEKLKAIGMLDEISVDVILDKGKEEISTQYFSDGQFQLVYIYTLIELFKEQNCLVLLDEPDCFLHPEWQFDFLEQIFDITDSAASNNHVLMTSHSALTVSKYSDAFINFFDISEEGVVVTKVSKAGVINSLSAGMISFSESEARLNINHVLKNTSCPILFTEGITDEIIIEIAWKKLFPADSIGFEVQNAFDRIFLRNLFSRDELRNNFPGRVMFALFDFDEAYDDWNGLKKRSDEGTNPLEGLIKKLECGFHYAMLLPVPNIEIVKRQVLKPDGSPWGKGSESHLPIELLFFKQEWIGVWYEEVNVGCGGTKIVFSGDKFKFAQEVVPIIEEKHFEIFRPMFEFISNNCASKKTISKKTVQKK